MEICRVEGKPYDFNENCWLSVISFEKKWNAGSPGHLARGVTLGGVVVGCLVLDGSPFVMSSSVALSLVASATELNSESLRLIRHLAVVTSRMNILYISKMISYTRVGVTRICGYDHEIAQRIV